MRIDLYWSFYSAYCYLGGIRLERARERYDFDIALRPVWPLAFRHPSALFDAPPAYMTYYDLDTARVAEQLGVPLANPDPEPATLDWSIRAPASEQPHIGRITRLGAEAERRGSGFAFARAFSDLVFARGPGWNRGSRMEDAIGKAGLDLAQMDGAIARDPQGYDAEIDANGIALETAGHWGTPTMVLDGEPFFGQDRVELLLWRMAQKGLKPCA